MKLVKQSSVAASLCDASVNLSAIGAFQIVENMITEFMGKQKIDGLTSIREYNAMWVFIRNRVEIYQTLHWMDEYTAECYISSIGNAKMIVDTVIKSNDKIAIAARTQICALDLSTGKIRCCDTVGIDEHILPTTPEINIEFTNTNFEPIELIDTCVSHFTDIDYCQHTNNMTYVRCIINQYSLSWIKENPITAIEIQFINQTFEGDKLEIYRCSNNNFSIRCNDKTVANCIITTEHKELSN